MRATFGVLILCGALTPLEAQAQRIGDPARSSVATPVAKPDAKPDAAARDSLNAGGLRGRRAPAARFHRDSSWWVPLTSTLVPGAGQAFLGQNRFIAYLAVEGYALLTAVDRLSEERRQRDELRAIAHDVARAFVSGDRPVGSWAYYENMEHFIESGVFNRGAAGTEFTPEVDRSTYNGFLWFDVRQRYFSSHNPEIEPAHSSSAYVNALNEYIARAYRPEMRWSWRNAQLEQDLYRRTVIRKNRASHDATMQFGLLAANHLLSTIDAFVSVRVRGGAGASSTPPALSLTVPWAPFGRVAPR